MRTAYKMERALNHKTAEIENLAFGFLISRRLEKINQKISKETTRRFREEHRYFSKETHWFIYLTKRQRECLWSYHQYRNIKLAASNLGLSDRAIEEHLKLVKKKFRLNKIKELMHEIRCHAIKYIENESSQKNIVLNRDVGR